MSANQIETSTSSQAHLEPARKAQHARSPESSYGQILRSSAVIGGASLVTTLIAAIRAKATAVILGPAGFGLMGLYSSIIDFVLAVTSLGIASAGVRQIAESVATGDTARVARTVTVLRRTAAGLGIISVVLLVAFARPISALTFGNTDHTLAVALLGLAVAFRLVSASQGALIQGMRRIRDLAAQGMLGALLGALITILLVYLFREQGVAPSLAASAGLGVLASWWYARRVRIPPPMMTRSEASEEALSLLRLGLAFMVSGLFVMGASYGVRTIVLRMEGLGAAGYYSAAWTLGGLYIGVILQAMGADFYPRLVGVVDDSSECNRLVNEQALVSVLLAGPGVIGTIIFAPVIVTLFYSSEFVESVETLRWMCLGVAIRTLAWPLGFIIIAKNRKLLFMLAEAGWAVANIALTWIWVEAYGLVGAGFAFLGSYIFYFLLLYPIVKQLNGFALSRQTITTAVAMLVPTSAAMASTHVLSPVAAIAIGTLLLIGLIAYSIRTLVNLVPWSNIPTRVRSMLVLLRLGPPERG